MIRNARVDANQKEIVQQLRAIGATVLHTHQLKNLYFALTGEELTIKELLTI